MMSKTRTAVWQQWDNIGLEYLYLLEQSNRIIIDSVVIGMGDSTLFRLDYQIRCDVHYQVQEVNLNFVGQPLIRLTTDGAGHWFDKQYNPLSALDNCLDIDISATPFTNTLPIRRLDWQVGQTRSLSMVYIRIPELIVERATQQYTCLEQTSKGSKFEFRQEDFSAILPIDADGFVQNYPNLFRRLS